MTEPSVSSLFEEGKQMFEEWTRRELLFALGAGSAGLMMSSSKMMAASAAGSDAPHVQRVVDCKATSGFDGRE